MQADLFGDALKDDFDFIYRNETTFERIITNP